MDMKKLAFALFFCISYISLVAQSKPIFKTGVEYNDYIVNLQMGIMNSITDFTATFDSTSKTYTESKRLALVNNSKNSLAKLKLMPAFKGNMSFRNAAIKLFEFYQLIAETDYKKMVDILFKEKITDADKAIMDELVKSVTEKESVFDKAFLGEQKKFAKENNFTLSTASEEEE
jgi:hypothetical protein